MAGPQVDRFAVDKGCRSQVAVAPAVRRGWVSRIAGRLVEVGDVADFVARTVAVVGILVPMEGLVADSSGGEALVAEHRKEAVVEADTSGVTIAAAGSGTVVGIVVVPLRTRGVLRSLAAL